MSFRIYPPHHSFGRYLRCASPKLLFLSTALLFSTSVQTEASEVTPDSRLASFETELLPILENNCFGCHADGVDKGGLSFDDYKETDKLNDHDLWLRVLKNVQAHAMPPKDEEPLSAEDRATLVRWIKEKAFALDPNQPDPGRVTIRRLNRVEYRNTVRDLLGVDFDTNEELPADDTGFGFDNIGSVLSVSPTLLEKLLDAAQKIVEAGVPTQPYVVGEHSFAGREFKFPDPALPDPQPTAKDFGIPQEFEEYLGKSAFEARYLSFYEPGVVQKTFRSEAGGAYDIALDLQTGERFRSVQEQLAPDRNRCLVRFKVNGTVVAEREFERMGQQSVTMNARVDMTAGENLLELALEPICTDAPQTRQLRLRFNSMKMQGPLAKEQWVRPANYRKFFGDGIPEDPVARRDYTARILSDFGGRAFRRPIDASTTNRLVALTESIAAQKDQTYEGAVAQAMVAILASPRFVFRAEAEEPVQPGQKYPYIDEYSLASRLSYFLWSSMPDDELFELARKNQLRANLSAQYERMLRDPKFSRFVSDFTGQWLQARDIEHVVIDHLSVHLRDKPNEEVEHAREVFRAMIERDPITFTPEEATAFNNADAILKRVEREPKPRLTTRLRRAMRQETEMLFAHIVKEDRSVLELLESDYTFLNQELARHYGISDVKGSEMRKVTLPPDSPRGGVLTQATVLAVTSNPTRSSPVKRGVFVLDNILGLPPAPPPPNIPALEDVASPEALKKMSMRESIAVHASNALCRSCHNRMDPLGLALDNFNALGVWRDAELNQPIDPSGTLISGESFSGIRELKRILVTSRRENFYHCLSEKLLTYALGRGMEYTDTTLLDQLVANLEESGGKMSVLLRGVIESPAFQQCRPLPAPLASRAP